MLPGVWVNFLLQSLTTCEKGNVGAHPSDFVSPPILVRNSIAKRGEIRGLPCLRPHSAAPGGEVNHTECAYDDSEGVTAEFNLNLLKRLNREVGMNFNPSLFRHLTRWNGEESR